MTNFVQVYKSTDVNAPTLTGQVGSLITVLNKCLVDGYTTGTVTSITRGGAGNLTATVTLNSADGTLVTGNYVVISGCTGTGNAQFNGTFQITVTSTTTFTYTMASDPGANASGSPVYAKAPLGWARPFSAGTNAQTYRSADTSSNRFYLQVVDNAVTTGGAKEANVYGAEVMSADQTVTSGRFPTSAQLTNGLGLRKSTTADSTARAWTLLGDDRTFYFVPNSGDNAGTCNQGFGFGYFIPFRPGDSYNTFIAGNGAFSNASNPSITNGLGSIYLPNTTYGINFFIPRLYNQIGTAVAGEIIGMTSTSPYTVGALNLVLYPNAPDQGLYVQSILVSDGAQQFRGRIPGLYGPLCNNPFNLYDEVTGVTGLSGVTLVCVPVSSAGTAGQFLVDKFGPWT